MMTIRQILNYYKNQPLLLRVYVVLRLIIVDLHKVLSYLPRNVNSVMEVACGYGMNSFLLASLYKGKKILCYDIDSRRINLLKSINPHANLEFHLKDASLLESFDADAILMVDFLHHIPYDQQRILLTKIHKTAPENVTIIIKDMDKGRYSIRQLCNYLIDIIHTGDFRFFYHDKKSFIDLFKSCNFKINKMDYINRAFIPLNHILFSLGKN